MGTPDGRDLLSMQNRVFAIYAFCTCILIIKMIFISVWTSLNRMTKKAFAFPEDYRLLVPDKKRKSSTNAEVERVRRAHNNDLQNTPLFLILGFLYIVTDPSVGVSMVVFGAFTMARTVHTIAYLFHMSVVRSLSFIIGLCATVYVIISIWISCTV